MGLIASGLGPADQNALRTIEPIKPLSFLYSENVGELVGSAFFNILHDKVQCSSC